MLHLNSRSLSMLSVAVLLASVGAVSAREASGAQKTASSPAGGSAAVTGLSVVSAFKNGENVPKQFTADGGDQSPPLSWSKLPASTKSIAIIVMDPDAPRGTWYHWLLYNLPSKTQSLNGGIPKQETLASGGMQGLNDFKHVGYNGPAPPPGSRHRYYFRVMALNSMLGIKPAATKEEVLNAVRGHILAEGSLMGYYSR